MIGSMLSSVTAPPMGIFQILTKLSTIDSASMTAHPVPRAFAWKNERRGRSGGGMSHADGFAFGSYVPVSMVVFLSLFCCVVEIP